MRAAEKKKILDFAYSFAEVAQKQNWVPRYDTESDSLSFTVPKLPDDARIKYFNDEIALYLDQKDVIRGLFIEYFKSNFIEHHKDLKDVLKRELQAKKVGDKSLREISPTKTKRVIPKMREAIKLSLIKDMGLKDV